ncbi:MAG: asparagine synthase (glutamine-hydrolyzing) [Deltaproteobacteria bacterium]|uniref:asparagine synthase (glutamine-hydrolyzing) n=1 Tax=Candidatus Desulfacyla euxinica TaxID=2841693 RepID=A0A8J6T5K0_9DELT|nr:asparagine synthase (glutamine-hydrolyzing) [Candidatus Desulfacyla euxinica]MBL7218022.1 asparagine synthase (glutamine-hydrolyzing) [Desulfobacteraceae bacterium]
MCGICGIINFDSLPVSQELLKKMCQTFSYRGPDDEGIYISERTARQGQKISVGLGHKRLSIIDLSAAGHQPMSNEDGSIWLTYNGEIYNFKEQRVELQAKGHAFKSHTDTEVILHLYEEEGPTCVHRLNGMFSFGIWDEKRARLWLCRDRIGIKPLVYYWDGKHFVFASEIKALLSNPFIPRELDYDALLLYLAFSFVPAPYTIFRGIRKLEPGHSLILEKGGLQIEKYWDVPQEPDLNASSASFYTQEEIIKKSLYEYLSEAVRKRMIADVPLGAFLSGGIDSSIIVGLMARHASGPVKTFSIGFKDDKLFDETHYAREAARLFKTDHHEFKLTYRDMLDALPDVLSTFDEPFADSSAIPTYIVSRETKRHVTVALAGDGGDELFAGYRSYLGEYWYNRYMMVPAILRDGLIESFFHTLPDSRDARVMEYIRRLKKFIGSTKGAFPERVMSLKAVFPQKFRKDLLFATGFGGNISEGDLPLEIVKNRLSSYRGDRINKILYSDLKDSLPGDMLTKVDWMSMKNSLEVRVPFLDHNVVEFAFKISGSLKLRKGKTKYLLKETFKDLLPPSLYNRPKAGFEIPISRWLKTDLRFLVDKFLDEERIKEEGIFEYDIIRHLKQALLANRTDTSWMLWNLIVFESWYENYLG